VEGNALMPLLSVDDVSRKFGSMWAVRDVKFAVERGELVGLIGPNGAGKSTLYNLIAGALLPTQGEIVFGGRRVTNLRSYQIARLGIARTFQIPKPYRQLTVVENVMLTAFQQDGSVRKARALAAECLQEVGLEDYLDAPIGRLTVGLLKRLEVARALAMRPKLVLFDEIMAGLTPTEVGVMTRFVASLPERGITVVWVEHVLHAIMKTATRIIVLNRGALIADGVPSVIARDPAVVKAYLGEEIALA
jgi:branched-chain amino acid transport system ATP-binding protein